MLYILLDIDGTILPAHTDNPERLNIQASSYMSFISENPEHWYKWDSIIHFCQTHSTNRVILCDDLASRENTPRPRPKNLVKMFQPDPRKGLTMRDLKKIERLASRID